MGRLYIKRQIQAHIVRDPVGVAVCIVGHVFLVIRVVILAGRQRRRTTSGIVEVAGEAVSLGKLIVEHSFHLMGPVILCRIPFSIVQRHSHPLVVLAEHGAGEGVVDPSVQFSCRLLSLKFYAIGLSLGRDHIGLKVVVHQQDCRTAIVEVVVDMLIVNLCRELIFLVSCLMIDTCRCLPAILGLDIQVGEFPDICRRHDGSVRHFMDILVHRVEAGLQGQVLL